MGPNPWLDEYIRAADRSRYPDPRYTQLREALGGLHGVASDRVVIGASSSELIWRVTRPWSALGRAVVVTSRRTYGEYLRAAQAMGLSVRSVARGTAEPHLLWRCNPDNPSGQIRDEVGSRSFLRRSVSRSRSHSSIRGRRPLPVPTMHSLYAWPLSSKLAGGR